MEEFQHNLQEGDLINIYTDYRQLKEFEGVARLVKRKSKGFTFMLTDEPMNTTLENLDLSSNPYRTLTPKQKERKRQYVRLLYLFEGVTKSGVHHVNPDLHNFYKLLGRKVTRDLDNPDLLDKILTKQKAKWKKDNNTKALVLFDEFDNITIIKFIQQTFLKNWAHTIWREDIWTVEFIPDQYCIKRKVCLFNSPFRTVRKIRIVVCINPNQDAQNSDIFHYCTKDGTTISNADRKEMRESKEEEDIEDEEFEDDFEESEETNNYTEDEMEFINEDEEDEELFKDIIEEKFPIYPTYEIFPTYNDDYYDDENYDN